MSKVEERGETGSVAAQEITLLPDFSLPPSVFFPPLSVTLHTLSNLQWLRLLLLPLLLFLMLFYACFLTATNILPPGQDLPPQYACRRACLRARTHTHLRPNPSRTHTNRLPLNPCFKEITEANEKRGERARKEGAPANRFICEPVPQLSNISITRVTQKMHRGLSLSKSARVKKGQSFINHTWISFTLVKSERYDACIWLRLHTVLLEIIFKGPILWKSHYDNVSNNNICL